LRIVSKIRTGISSMRKRRGELLEAGFTLIELMIVITIMLILIGMAAANYGKFIQRANEAVLKHNLRTMREMIDHYTVDKQTAPQSLEGLSQAGYLRDVPVDPMTRRKEWAPKYDLVFVLPDQASVGIVDVSSKSTRTALDGTKYSEW
jgi:general secretion pathway protein G